VQSLIDACRDMSPGHVRLALAEDVAALLGSLELGALAGEDACLLIGGVFDQPMTLADSLDVVLCALADAARARWPNWTAVSDTQWRLRAADYARLGRPPLPRGYTVQQQYAQLSALLDAKGVLLLAAYAAAVTEAGLEVMTRAAAWLGAHSRRPVLLLLPRAVEQQAAVLRMGYQAAYVSSPEIQAEAATARGPQEYKIAIWPLLGNPHPRSPGEQALAAAFVQDAELHGLFQFNASVITRQGSRYIVDLLWQVGGLIIEVDGYSTHAGRVAFALDRQRDYELMLSGYRVLRLTHDEVMQDVRHVLSKVHAAVQYCRDAVAMTDR